MSLYDILDRLLFGKCHLKDSISLFQSFNLGGANDFGSSPADGPSFGGGSGTGSSSGGSGSSGSGSVTSQGTDDQGQVGTTEPANRSQPKCKKCKS